MSSINNTEVSVPDKLNITQFNIGINGYKIQPNHQDIKIELKDVSPTHRRTFGITIPCIIKIDSMKLSKEEIVSYLEKTNDAVFGGIVGNGSYDVLKNSISKVGGVKKFGTVVSFAAISSVLGKIGIGIAIASAIYQLSSEADIKDDNQGVIIPAVTLPCTILFNAYFKCTESSGTNCLNLESFSNGQLNIQTKDITSEENLTIHFSVTYQV